MWMGRGDVGTCMGGMYELGKGEEMARDGGGNSG